MLASIPWWVLYSGGGLLLLVTTPLLLASLYLAYVHRKYSYLPSPKRDSFFLGHLANILAMRRQLKNEDEPLATIISKWAAEHGNLFVLFFSYRPLVASTNPEDTKKVAFEESIEKPNILTDCTSKIFGQRFMGRGLLTIVDYDTWKPRRKLYDPSFKRSSLKELLPKFNECVDALLEKLRPLADGRTEVPMKEVFHEAALDVISKVAFSSDFNQGWDSKSLGLKYTANTKLSHLASTSLKAIGKSFSAPIKALFKLMHPHETAMYCEAAVAMRRIGQDCIEKRIKAVTSGEEVPNDILSQILQSSLSDRSVDMETLLDDFVTFYIAGQETTAATLSYAIILLHQHPEVLDRLLSEVEDVLGDRKEVTGDDLDKMKYTEQVIHEVLRMYPVASFIFKDAPKGGIIMSGYHIPEGTGMTFWTFVMCRNPEYFSDPDTFDPSRFDAGKPRPGPFVYFPFGLGHRSCIGQHFAMIEAKLILSRLLQTFKVTLPPSYQLVLEDRFTLQPKGEVPCTLEEIVH